MRAVDLFAGAGGLSLGLMTAGFDVSYAVELDRDSAATYRASHPDTKLHESDVRNVDLAALRGDVDLVAGGPPCQPWSDGGRRLGADDPRDLLPEFLRAVREIQPEAFLLENVAGLSRGSRTTRFRALVNDFEQLGFYVHWSILSAADFGVPQRRKRLFVVGTRRPGFSWPEPTHGPGRPNPFVTSGHVLTISTVEGEPNPSKVTYARNPDLRPNPYDGHIYNGGGRPINPLDLAPTMLASMGGNKTPWVDTLGIVPEYHAHLMRGGQPRQGEVPGARRITAAEAARLQTFPSNIVFFGARSSQYRQVGNAVPPALAAAVAETLHRQLA